MSGRLLRLLIFGAPGSGKGTISNWIQRDYKIAQVSSGDLLRRQIASQTETGKQAQKIVEAGGLVPDKLMVALILDELLNKHGNESFLLDGFPRTLPQAEALDQALAKAKGGPYSLDYVVHVDVPASTIVDRIKGRLVHIPSGRVYNTDFNPPKVPMTDDVTGERLTKRADDEPEAVRARLRLYEEKSSPVLAYYEKTGLLGRFTGETSKSIYDKLRVKLDQLTS